MWTRGQRRVGGARSASDEKQRDHEEAAMGLHGAPLKSNGGASE
jgi:hypothetical protein